MLDCICRGLLHAHSPSWPFLLCSLSPSPSLSTFSFLLLPSPPPQSCPSHSHICTSPALPFQPSRPRDETVITTSPFSGRWSSATAPPRLPTLSLLLPPLLCSLSPSPPFLLTAPHTIRSVRSPPYPFPLMPPDDTSTTTLDDGRLSLSLRILLWLSSPPLIKGMAVKPEVSRELGKVCTKGRGGKRAGQGYEEQGLISGQGGF